MPSQCPHCLRSFEVPLPVEPLYSYTSARWMIPCTDAALKQLVFRYKSRLQAPVYRRHPTNPRLRVRYLFGSDIQVLRSVLFSNDQHRPKKKGGVPDEQA